MSTVPIVQATWGKQAGVIEYFSDVKDSRIPTTELGIPNTERGQFLHRRSFVLEEKFSFVSIQKSH